MPDILEGISLRGVSFDGLVVAHSNKESRMALKQDKRTASIEASVCLNRISQSSRDIVFQTIHQPFQLILTKIRNEINKRYNVNWLRIREYPFSITPL